MIWDKRFVQRLDFMHSCKCRHPLPHVPITCWWNSHDMKFIANFCHALFGTEKWYEGVLTFASIHNTSLYCILKRFQKIFFDLTPCCFWKFFNKLNMLWDFVSGKLIFKK